MLLAICHQRAIMLGRSWFIIIAIAAWQFHLSLRIRLQCPSSLYEVSCSNSFR